MRVLLVGSGGREHALAWAVSKSPLVDSLLMLPGNPGMEPLGAIIEGISPTDAGAVAAVSAAQGVDLVVVGPEAPLAAGVVDALAARGIPAFGPRRAAARLESSKAFAKEVMARAGVATGAAEVFTEREAALSHLRQHPGPYVVKADGLAAGKGVLVTEDRAAAEAWVGRCLDGGFGAAGSTLVIEQFLEGSELSVFAVCAGGSASSMEPARDYKRLVEGDDGPNTGGMGAFSPVDLPPGLVERVRQEVILPVLAVMDADGNPYSGFLYVGLVLTSDGPKVLEFNCRLGDPEAQVILPRLEDDLVEVMLAALDGRLPADGLSWSDRAAVDVVLAAEGYPEAPRRGDTIAGVEAAAQLDDTLIFHSGTARHDGRLATAGGRVLNIVGLGEDLHAARATAYRAVEKIRFPGMLFRRDIGA